jgi:3-phenylpropionate/trans-cinnamate dioxygenase ferredoxin component
MLCPTVIWKMYNYTTLEPDKAEFLEIAPADQLPDGERMFIEVEGKSIVIFNLAGQLFAIGDVCSHDNGPVGDGEIEENEIICPRHGARFDIRTGKATSLPAVVDIPAYPVRVKDGIIQIGMPKA